MTGRESSFLSRKTSQRGSQLKHRRTLNISVGSTVNANSPFNDRTGLRETNSGKWLTASGSSFTGVGNPQARIPAPVRDKLVRGKLVRDK
jgi:hypothetical protein